MSNDWLNTVNSENFLRYFPVLPLVTGNLQLVTCNLQLVTGNLQLIHLIRHHHLKRRNIHLKSLFVIYIFHHVFSKHFSHLCFKVATAHILKLLPRLHYRLLPNDALTFYLPVLAIAVKNVPVPAMQLHRKAVMIFERYAISKHKLTVYRVAVVRLIKRLHTYLHSLRKL